MHDLPSYAVNAAVNLAERASTTSSTSSRPPVYKAIGLSLAICSGLFIGVSFVIKKVGLLQANKKYNEAAGEGYGYLKNWFWWLGMTLMIVGEICNFVAYAFVDAILVTPMGALSVVVTAILSAIFLKERLSFVGKLGCFNCIIGSVVIVLNAPDQSTVSDIQEMQHYVISPGFLSYAGVILVGAVITALWVGPRYGKKSMLVYLSVCSWVGGLSVVATQGLGAAIVTQISGVSQFTHWFLYVLLVFVICTLVTEVIYLNVSPARIALRRGSDYTPESLESLQRCAGYTYLLCLLYFDDNHHLCRLVPGLQRQSHSDNNGGHGISPDLHGSGVTAIGKVIERCS